MMRAPTPTNAPNPNFTVFRVPKAETARTAAEMQQAPNGGLRTDALLLPVPPAPTMNIASQTPSIPHTPTPRAPVQNPGVNLVSSSISSDSSAPSPAASARGRSQNRSSAARQASSDDVAEYEESSLNWMKTGRVLRIKETGESYRFPLSKSNLPHADITPEIAEHLRATLEESIQRAIKMGAVTWMENPCMSPLNAKHQWKVHQQKKDASMYRRKADGMMQRNFLLRSRFDCSLDDMMLSLLNTNTEDERTFLANAYREEFLDGSVVAVLEYPSIEDPYHLFAIKWCAFQTPMDSMFSARDMMYAEYSQTIVDKGQRYVARIIQSIKDCNITERRLHFVRNEMWSVQLFRSLPGANDKRVDMTMSGTISFPPNSSTPTYIGNRFLTSLFSMSAGMAYAADAKYIVNNDLLSQKAWVPNNERSCCNVCFKSFGFLRSRHHCRVCSEIMCTTCMMELSLRTSKLPPMLRPEGCLVSTEKFCYNCIIKGRERRGSMLLQIMAASNETDESGGESRRPSDDVQSSVSSSCGSPENVGWSSRGLRKKQSFTAGGEPTSQDSNRGRTGTATRDGRRDDDDSAFQANGLGPMDENSVQGNGPDGLPGAPLPSSMAHVEKSIAAQQALLRSMMLEGQKIMAQQHRTYQSVPSYQYDQITGSDEFESTTPALSPPPPHEASIEALD